MRLHVAATALALAVSAGHTSSFVPHPAHNAHITCYLGITATGTGTPPGLTGSKLSRLHQRPRFVEEDFDFDDEDDFGDGEYNNDYDRTRSAPRERRQRQSPPRQQQQQQQQKGGRRRRDADLDDATSRRPSSRVREALGTITLEDDDDSDNMKTMTTTGSAAPIVPTRNGRRSNYLQEEDEWGDDEFDDQDFDNEFDDDYYDDNEDEASSSGNFWTNPEGGLDPYPSSSRADSRSGRRRKSTTRGRMPPSTAEPQPDTKPRGRSRSQSRERGAGGRPVDAYGRPPPSRRRPGAIQKTTFRSGTPPPPPLMKDFYDRFFWYGFDPRETTSPTDRTMFGGTKGKFSGLDVLREVDGKPASRRGPHGERMREREEYDEDDEWDDFDDEDDDYLDDDFDDPSNGAIIPKPLLPGLSMEEKRSRRPLPPRSRRRKENQKPREPRAPRNDRMWFDDDDDGDYDGGDYEVRTRNGRRSKRERRSQSSNNRRSRKGRFESNREWASDEVSSWFTDDDDGDVIDLWPSRDSNNNDDDEYWRDDSFEQPVSRRGPSSRRRRKRDRRSGRRRQDDTAPLLTFVESVFGMDSNYIDEKAREYEEKIGRAKPPSTRNSRSSVRNEVSRRRRAGYAYRYEEDEDDSPTVAEFAPSRYSDDELDADTEGSFGAISSESTNGDVIDVPAEKMVVRRNGDASARQMKKKRRRKRPSWEDRESEELDRIPPAGITAYGPQGDVMGGIDARTYAALKVSEEIREAKRKVSAREERVIDAEERILMLKADVEEQKKIFAQSRQRNSPRVRDAQRQMNMMVEDAARSLRKARAELEVAVDAAEDLEDRHWVLLSQVASDEEFARLNAKAEREEEEGSEVTSVINDEVVTDDADDVDDVVDDGVNTEACSDDKSEDEGQVEMPKIELKGGGTDNAKPQGDGKGNDEQPAE